MKQYIVEISIAETVIRQQSLAAETLDRAKAEAQRLLGSQDAGALTILERTEDGCGVHVRPRAARLATDRRTTDWVDFN
jgi:hypothetical protein